MNLGAGNFKTQFRRADRSSAPLALIVGDDELELGSHTRMRWRWTS